MKWRCLVLLILCLAVGVGQSASAAAINSSLGNAKTAVETKGNVFITSREEIVARVKKEGKL